MAHIVGEDNQAIKYYEEAITVAKQVGDRQSEGKWLGPLGIAYRSQGQSKSLASHETALQIARELGDRREEGVQIGRLGILYRDLGYIEKSVDCYEHALTMARELGIVFKKEWNLVILE